MSKELKNLINLNGAIYDPLYIVNDDVCFKLNKLFNGYFESNGLSENQFTCNVRGLTVNGRYELKVRITIDLPQHLRMENTIDVMSLSLSGDANHLLEFIKFGVFHVWRVPTSDDYHYIIQNEKQEKRVLNLWYIDQKINSFCQSIFNLIVDSESFKMDITKHIKT